MKVISEMKFEHWTKDEIRVDVFQIDVWILVLGFIAQSVLFTPD